MIDSHSHLNDDYFSGSLDELIESCKKKNINKIICPGWDIESSKKAIKISHKYDIVYSAVGIHPQNVKDFSLDSLKTIEELSHDAKCVAIGEIGLDYYWTKETIEKEKLFLYEQLKLAKKVNLPVLIHLRDATEDFLKIVDQFIGEYGKSENIGVMHCFSGSKETMDRCLKQGFYISFGGPVTFKNAKSVKENAKTCDIDKILIETDAPYLSPHPFRGKANKPLYVELVLNEIAKLRDMEVSKLEEVIDNNLNKLFKF